SFGVELLRVDIDHHGAEFSAVRERNGRAGNGGELSADEVLAEVEEFLFAQGFAFEAELDDGDAGRIVLKDVGRGGSGREDAEQGLRDGGDLRERHFDLRVRLEEDAGDGDAAVRLGFDVLDIVDDGGEGALEEGDDALLHFFG